MPRIRLTPRRFRGKDVPVGNLQHEIPSFGPEAGSPTADTFAAPCKRQRQRGRGHAQRMDSRRWSPKRKLR